MKNDIRFITNSSLTTDTTTHPSLSINQMDMSIINHLPSPSEIFRLTLSLLNSTLIASNRRVPDGGRHSLTKFDVDPESGFFPPHQLPRLPEEFDIWEIALTEAQDTLSLGEDGSEMAMERRAAGEVWRANIRSVSIQKQ